MLLNNPPLLLYKIWRDAGPVGDNKRTAATKKKEDACIKKKEIKDLLEQLNKINKE